MKNIPGVLIAIIMLVTNIMLGGVCLMGLLLILNMLVLKRAFFVAWQGW